MPLIRAKPLNKVVKMTEISAINVIHVPEGMEAQAVEIRDEYIAYFQQQAGFVSSTFYESLNLDNSFNYINIVVWESQAAYDAVVNLGYANAEGINADGMKVLGKGFPSPISVNPGQYQVIRHNDGEKK